MRALLTPETINYVVYAGTFLGILLVFTGLAQLLQRGESRNEARNRRMRMIETGASAEEILALLKPEAPSGGMARLPFIGQLPANLSQAGMTIPPSQFILICGFGTAVGFVVAAIFLPLLAAAILAVALGLFLPVALVRSQRDKRVEKLIAQLPDALELMARGLKVGHPLNASIQSVAKEMPDPIGTEFGLIFDQVSFGDDLVDAFEDFAGRFPIEDVHYLAASIGIQHGTGGDLARVISVLSRVIRDRMAMRRRVRAISSEGRLTAIFLSAIPPLIFGATSILTPDYFGSVRGDPLFLPMMATIATLTVLNFLVLRKLVNFHF